MSLGRRLRTVRHLRARQLWHRLRLTARRKAWERRSVRVDRRYRLRSQQLGVYPWAHPGLGEVARFRAEAHASPAIAREVMQGRFTLLGEPREMGAEVDWFRADLDQGTRLWKTLLHEFSYAVDLAAAHRETPGGGHRERLFALIQGWQEVSQIGCRGFARDVWNARAVARRLVNWAIAGALLELEPHDLEGRELAREIGRHGLFLRDNLELDLLGNHLMTDAVGLVFANELVGGIPDALRWLERQIAQQILPDGCHIERAPMYQAVIVQELLEVRLLLGNGAPRWLDDGLARAAGWLEAILLGDGDLPLLGDGWLGETRPTLLLERVRGLLGALPAPREPERHGGIVPVVAGSLRAVLRAGPHGPDYQMGHAHADLLSFDLSFGPRRAITDTGTALYDPGPERQALRSTAAHNTLELDGEEQLEAWGSFRVGRRGRARVVARGVSEGWEWVWASHDAYRHLPGAPTPHRLWLVAPQAVLVLDAVLGGGRHRIASRLHLHPDFPAEELRVAPLGVTSRSATATLMEHFGQRRPMAQLSGEADSELPWGGGWLISFGSAADEMEPELRVRAGRLAARLPGPDGRSVCWQPESDNPAKGVEISLCSRERGSAN